MHYYYVTNFDCREMEGTICPFTVAKLYCISIILLLHSSRKALSQCKVPYLPGFDGPLPFELETGYVSIDDVNLFYYFVKSENKPSEDPLLLWLTGGPGCSVLTALAFEIGPFNFKAGGAPDSGGSLPSLVLNPNSWTKVANIIFLDAPVGTGFSYSKSLQGSYSGDVKSATQSHTFIVKWLNNHPEFLGNPLYIGGDSYSGKTVPIIVQLLSDGIKAGYKPLINLKGYLLGNPLTDPGLEENSNVPYLYGMGIISEELFEATRKTCRGDYTKARDHTVQCITNLNAISKCTSGLNHNHILEPECSFASPKPRGILRDRSLQEQKYKLSLHAEEPECRSNGYTLSYQWANDETVQNALNIRKEKIDKWVRCNYFGIHYVYDVKQTIPYHVNLSKRGYRSLIYSGDHDLVVPYLSTHEWIRSLNYSVSDKWRPWLVENQVSGFTTAYTNNMTFATVKGGGHTAPEYKPKECFAMFKRWLSNKPL